MVKIQDNCENELTNDGLDTVSCFLLPSEQTENSPAESPDFIQRALNAGKLKIVVVDIWICDPFFLYRTFVNFYSQRLVMRYMVGVRVSLQTI